MHIPDGFLDTKTWIGMGGISTVFIGIGEGFITIATLSLITRVRPDLLELQRI